MADFWAVVKTLVLIVIIAILVAYVVNLTTPLAGLGRDAFNEFRAGLGPGGELNPVWLFDTWLGGACGPAGWTRTALTGFQGLAALAAIVWLYRFARRAAGS